MDIDAASNLNVINEPGRSQSTGGKHHQWGVDVFRGGQVGLWAHCNIVGFPAGCGQRRNCGIFQFGGVGFAGTDGAADFVEQAIQVRRLGTLGFAQVSIAR